MLYKHRDIKSKGQRVAVILHEDIHHVLNFVFFFNFDSFFFLSVISPKSYTLKKMSYATLLVCSHAKVLRHF